MWCWRAPPPLPPPGDWRRLAYKGDQLLRPIASNEVAPLARLLVGASTAVNTALGLDGVPHPQQEPAETLLQVGLRKGGGLPATGTSTRCAHRVQCAAPGLHWVWDQHASAACLIG